jgi:hypothetical protein
MSPGVVQLGVIGLVVALLLGIPAMVWGPGYLRYRQEMRVRATGAPALARVVSLTDTGNRFNATPEIRITLEVTAEGRAPWRATITRVLSVVDAPAFAPGREFAVRYDPEHPERVAVAP